jgi:ADP-ribose pyrophosphatase YjhB (NUDIX family)
MTTRQKKKFCPFCGGTLIQNELEGRIRDQCARCGVILYENPLPVVSSVLVNEKREVLLVKRKRDPYKNMWCLPMGFMEYDERVEDGALRELQEETHVEGKVVQLLSADSTPNYLYGDLLVVSFEIEQTGGRIEAGDDALNVQFFPIDNCPKFAFPPNRKAIERYVMLHKDSWAMQDSFRHLSLPRVDTGEEGFCFLSDLLVQTIETKAAAIVELWAEDVTTNPSTPSYHKYDKSVLYLRTLHLIGQFSHWLSCGEEVEEEIETFHIKMGERMEHEGFELSEVISALSLLRKHMWKYARSQGMWNRPIDIYRVLELDRRFVIFFDKASFNIIRGYERNRSMRS